MSDPTRVPSPQQDAIVRRVRDTLQDLRASLTRLAATAEEE